MISVLPDQKDNILKIFETIKKDSNIKDLIKKNRPELVYIMPSDFFLMAIITDMERLYPIEFERPAGSNVLIRFLKIFINYTKMQIGIYQDIHDLRRIIFVSVKDFKGESLLNRSIFSLGSKRYPLFQVDMNLATGEVISVKELKPRHKWGDAPMPIF